MSVTGVEARRVRELGDAVIPPGLEADAIDVGNGDEIIYQYFNEGFVSVGDWADVDADAMLAEIKENGNKSNALRRERGVPELHTTGWIERPSLNRDTNTVSWIIEGDGGDGTKFINAVALKLGRNGFEKITWITDPNSLSASLDGFHAAINSHKFNPGYRYLDHVATDRAATYGVAGLVAGVLGVKLAKAVGVGAFAVLSVLAKKLSFLIVLPFVAVGAFFRRLFRRKSSCDPLTKRGAVPAHHCRHRRRNGRQRWAVRPAFAVDRSGRVGDSHRSRRGRRSVMPQRAAACVVVSRSPVAELQATSAGLR